jgi:hydroxymethylpyrimidine/phosphomethylpyrimidine kinase
VVSRLVLRPVSSSVLVVGGMDPSGGAGLLRDVATVRALGGRALTVQTADTRQGAGVHQVAPAAPELLRQELRSALQAGPTAVKIGMAVGPATAQVLLEALSGYAGPVVVDPVLATSRGGALWAGAPRALLPLLRRATLCTPNALEAAALTGRLVATADDAELLGRQLIDSDGLRAVLVKGGHLATADDETVADVLVTAAGSTRFFRARVPGPSPRGTGCALASAIAVMLGRGSGLDEAVRDAGDWLAELIADPIVVGDERHLSHVADVADTADLADAGDAD